MNAMVLVCRWCGDIIVPVTSEPGVYTHDKDGYAPCWDYAAGDVNAEPVLVDPEGGVA